MSDPFPPEADRERLGAELAEQFSEWASAEGLLTRITEEQCADLAKAYIAGAVSAAVAAAPHITTAGMDLIIMYGRTADLRAALSRAEQIIENRDRYIEQLEREAAAREATP